ncbi:MAG: peptidase S15 [Gammaproteobacteria bacterium]|nr:peptidase S15 [Gammaproteobacteria bacterium]
MRLLILGLVLLSTACTAPSTSNNDGSRGGNPPAQAASFSDAVVASKADGTEIAFTAFRPELAAGETAPLLIHGHGWALSRVKDFNPSNPVTGFIQTEISAVVAQRAWEEGYFVISFDQRGWGESGGTVQLMDPDFEGQDVSSLIDWAVENFGVHLASEGDDPIVGSIGLSYGGGFQTIGSAVDDRFDAIVPIITWHDLRNSLFPGGVPKSIWAAFLVLAGTPTSQFSLSPEIYQAFLSGATTMNVDEGFINKLGNNSLVSFCEGREDGRGVPDVDALFVQGAHDVLFNMTEAEMNRACLKNAGNDARLVVQRDGHIVPVVQQSGELILFGMQETIHCGNQDFDTADVMYQFLEEKLRGGTATGLPEVCISQAETGQAFNVMPIGGDTANVQVDNVVTGLLVETVLGLLLDLDPGTLVDVLTQLPADVTTVVTTLLTGLGNPTKDLPAVLPALLNVLPQNLIDELLTFQHFAPVATAGPNQALAGIPTAAITLSPTLAETPLSDPIVFLGVAVDPAGGGGRYLVNDQVVPVRGFGEHQLNLAGVTAKVEEGDQVGLVVMPFHTQFVSSYSRIPEPVSVSGIAAMPLVDDQQSR